MKRIWILWMTALLLCACSLQKAGPQADISAAAAQAADTTAGIEMPVPTAIAPINPIAAVAVPTAEPTAAPTVDPFAAHFSDEPQLNERSYTSKYISVTVTSYSVDETYGRHVDYHVADIYVRDVTSIRTEAGRGDFGMRYERTVKEIASDAGALIAIVGDTYTHAKQSFVIRNGVLYRDTPIADTDLCILYRNGVMETKKWGTFTKQEIIDADPWQVWGFGPALLNENGKAMDIHHELMGHNPRAAIGYYEPGHYCFVVVDGRGESVGVTLNSLSRLMEDLGCKVAYNLDGGASAQIYWNGEIINTPSKKNRVVSDIIYLLPEE